MVRFREAVRKMIFASRFNKMMSAFKINKDHLENEAKMQVAQSAKAQLMTTALKRTLSVRIQKQQI